MLIDTARPLSPPIRKGWRRPGRRSRGLGSGGQAVTTTVGTSILSVAPYTGPAAPFVAIAGGITAILGTLGIGSGCGQTCVAASNTANAIETAMKNNLAAFQAGQIDRETALANFQALWNQLVMSCQQIGGQGGQSCIDDRKQGACHFKDAQGNCWSWWSGYFDPINNAAAGVSSPAPTVAAGISWLPLLAIGLIALATLE